MVPNEKLGRLLQKAVANTKDTASFDDLPVAFRAVAMDLLTGDEIVLKSGSLDRAMLATLSGPGTLPPVDIDSYTRTADDLNSVLGIVDQVNHLLQRHNTQESLAALTPSDIIIKPAVGPARKRISRRLQIE